MKKGIKIKLFAILAAVLVTVVALCGCGGNSGGNVTPTPVPSNGGDKTRTLADIVAASERLAVEVATVDQVGTGTVIATDEECVTIATCYHLTGYDAAHAEFRFYGETAFIGGEAVKLVGYSQQFDLAIFEVKKAGYDGVKPALSEGLAKKGEEVVALGNAYGLGVAAFDGVVSLPETVESEENFLKPMTRVTAASNPGSSGAPIMTSDGKLMGIILGKYSGGEGMTYVLPIAIVNALYENALGGTDNGRIAYTALKFTAGEVTENDVTEKKIAVTIGAADDTAEVMYADGEFTKITADGSVKIEKVSGKDCPKNLIDFTAEAVRKNKVSLTAGNFSQEI